MGSDGMSTYRPTRANGALADKVQRAHELRRAMTPAEARLWRELRPFRMRGYAFRRQQVIAGFIADFYCHQAQLVVEVDGSVHAGQRAYDAERDTIIAAHGLHILRITNDQVRDQRPDVVAQIAALCPPRAEA
jgi:very-short-patch-repair endonuclease